MFEQNVADGANLFITIVGVIIGFAAAIGYIDYQKVKKEEEKH
jgi:predicted negative regulator of RcsB-dependent stress response